MIEKNSNRTWHIIICSHITIFLGNGKSKSSEFKTSNPPVLWNEILIYRYTVFFCSPGHC